MLIDLASREVLNGKIKHDATKGGLQGSVLFQVEKHQEIREKARFFGYPAGFQVQQEEFTTE